MNQELKVLLKEHKDIVGFRRWGGGGGGIRANANGEEKFL